MMSNEERLLILLLTREIAEGAKGEVRALVKDEGFCWQLFMRLAEVHKVENFIYSNLRVNGLIGVLPAKVEARLKAIYYQVSIRNTQFQNLVENISTLCYGTRIVLVKGSALIYDFYQDLGARRLADVDILVRKDDRDAVWRALTAGGWNSDNWPGFKSKVHGEVNDALYKTMHYLYYGHLDNQLFIDIHWKFYVGEGADAAAAYAMDGCRKLKNNIYVHSDEMQLVHLCCNNYLDCVQHGAMFLRNLCDINEFMKARKVDWERVEYIMGMGGFMREAVNETLRVIKALFEGEDESVTPESILRFPIQKEKSGAIGSLKEKIKVLDTTKKRLEFIYKELVPDGQWLRGMYEDRKVPLLAYLGYMVKRHILHKKIDFRGH